MLSTPDSFIMPIEFWRKATVPSFAHLCFVPYLMQFKNQNKTTPLTFFQRSSLAKSTDALGPFPVFRIIIDISFGIVSLFHYYMRLLASANNVRTVFPIWATIYFLPLYQSLSPTWSYSQLLSQQPSQFSYHFLFQLWPHSALSKSFGLKQ